MTTVVGSGASVDFSWRMLDAADLLIPIRRSNDHLIAFASSGEPSANLSPERSLNVYRRLSSDTVQDSARSGSTSSGAPGLGAPGRSCTRPSYTRTMASRALPSTVWCGAMLVVSPPARPDTVPPRLARVLPDGHL